MDRNIDLPKGWKKDLIILFITILPAIVVAAILYMMGPDVYLPAAAVVGNFYFAIGVGWITSPLVGLITGINPILLVLFLVFVSMESSLIVSVNYDILEKIPLLGRGIRGVRKRAERIIEKHELAKNVGYISIFWLMFTPLYGTGPMSMSFVGRILALDWLKVWITISLSSLTRYTLLVLVIYYGIF